MSGHDIAAEWLQIAYDDYDSALYLLERPHRKPLEIICYHCQQSVEKALKAYICAKDIEIPKTHETGILCRRCAEIASAFSSYIPQCEEIAIYATGTRYPVRIEIDEEAARTALQQALEIYNFVRGILGRS